MTSHYERIRAANSSVVGHNDAVSGAWMSDARTRRPALSVKVPST